MRPRETFSGYDLNIISSTSKKNPANASSNQPDYAKAPGGYFAATILTARYNAMFRLWQLYAAVIHESQIFK